MLPEEWEKWHIERNPPLLREEQQIAFTGVEQPETLGADVPGEAPSCTGDLTGSPSKAQSPSRAEQAITTKE